MNKKEVKKEAKDLLKKGVSKQETYLLLKEKYKSPKEIAEIIKNIPSKSAFNKYKIWNYLLLALLVITTTLVMIGAPSIGFLLWYGLIIIVVALVLIKYYMWVSIFSGLAMIGIIWGIFSSESINWIMILLGIVLILPAIILPIWLSKKMCPPPIEKKVKYLDKAGHQRLKLVYEFVD